MAVTQSIVSALLYYKKEIDGAWNMVPLVLMWVVLRERNGELLKV